MYVKIGVTPIQVDIWFKNGGKLSTIDYFENPDSIDPNRLCEQRIENMESIFAKNGNISAVIFGGLIVNAEDISAIKYTPYFGK